MSIVLVNISRQASSLQHLRRFASFRAEDPWQLSRARPGAVTRTVAGIRWRVGWRMTISIAGHQFPPAIIGHAVWLYLRFTLSYRGAEDPLAERGLDASYETVQRWV